MEARIDHLQWTENAVLQEFVEATSRHDFDDPRQHVDTPTVFPYRPGLVRQRQRAEARDELRQGPVPREDGLLAVELVERRVRILWRIDEAGGVTEEVA